MINEDDDIMLEQSREEQVAAIDQTFTFAGKHVWTQLDFDQWHIS